MIGALAWVVAFLFAGYWFGQIPTREAQLPHRDPRDHRDLDPADRGRVSAREAPAGGGGLRLARPGPRSRSWPRLARRFPPAILSAEGGRDGQARTGGLRAGGGAAPRRSPDAAVRNGGGPPARRAAPGARPRLRAACGPGGAGRAAKEPIRVGHFASLTGDTATFGQSTDRGIRMAIEEINARGGVLGRPLEVISEDDRSITEEARTAAQKLLQRDQVVALLGEVASSRSLAGGAEAQRARVPMISPASTNPQGHRGRRLHLPRLLHRSLPGRGDGALRRTRT